MKRLLNYIFTLTLLTLTSCSEPIREYILNDDVQHITLKLYADSTFIQQVEEIEDSYEYSGNWKGSLEEDSTFTTVATKKGFQIITLTPTNIYQIKNGTAVRLENKEIKSNTPELNAEKKFIDYPIPELDSIFPFFETSGAVENSPSEKYFNPTDSGIFVFYTLFDKTKMRNTKYSFDEINIGTLTTHTYRKPKYGWSETDKDQDFILLQLDGLPIKIGKSIQIGSSFEELTNELGKPIYQIDSSFVFLGKNKIIGQFNFKNGQLESLTYGRYNLTDDIFDVDSIARKEMIEEKLKVKK
jgi:hypothetical protein